MSRIYKIASQAEWTQAQGAGVFEGSAFDLADGYIHFSTMAQMPETARRHFAGRTDLVLLAVETGALGAAVRWEPSRGGDLFPHLYGVLPVSAVLDSRRLVLGPDGAHRPERPAAESAGPQGAGPRGAGPQGAGPQGVGPGRAR